MAILFSQRITRIPQEPAGKKNVRKNSKRGRDRIRIKPDILMKLLELRRIMNVVKSEDGQIRVVELRVRGGTVRRLPNLLIPLDVRQETIR